MREFATKAPPIKSWQKKSSKTGTLQPLHFDRAASPHYLTDILQPKAYLQQSASHNLVNNFFANHLVVRQSRSPMPSDNRHRPHRLLIPPCVGDNLLHRLLYHGQRTARET